MLTSKLRGTTEDLGRGWIKPYGHLAYRRLYTTYKMVSIAPQHLSSPLGLHLDQAMMVLERRRGNLSACPFSLFFGGSNASGLSSGDSILSPMILITIFYTEIQ